MKKLISIFILFFFIGCSLTPDYSRPENLAKELEKFKNAPDSEGKEEISRWWTRIDDPLSEELVDKLLTQNFSIEAAYARMRQAVENSIIAGADLYPMLSGESSYGRTKMPAISQSVATGKPFSDFNLNLATSWQLDLFGRTQSNLDGRTAELEARIFDIDALIQDLIAQVVNQRIAVASSRARVLLTEQTIKTRENTLNIVERRYRSGLGSTSALDLRLARENLASAKAELPSVKAEYQESIYQLDLLLGQNPGKSEDLDFSKFDIIPPPQEIKIPPPAKLLDRRPDLQASELRVIAANEDIGVAIADLFPDLTISGRFGTNTREASDLLLSEKIAWSFLNSLTQRIFAGGALRANIRFNEARKDELIANYKNDILTAVMEVETALLYDKALSEQVELLEKNLEETTHAANIADERYQKGVGGILELLDIERRKWQTAQNLLNVQQAYWQNRIALYLALGGDWDYTKEQDDRKN